MTSLRTILTAALLLGGVCLSAQTKIDKLYIDTRGIFHQETVNGVYSSQFLADHLNLNVTGKIADGIGFRIRQRLNKKVFDENNIFNATDFLYVDWKPTDTRWHFLFGKNAVLIGGYEYDAVPIDVYFYSQFCSNLYQGFTFGATVGYSILEGQELAFQVCNSPLSLGFENVYAYNFGWLGRFASWWRTIWTFNLVEDPFHRMISYISLGNHFQWDNLLFDVDLMNRGAFSQKRYFGTDYTLISKLIWRVGNWNICAKGGLEGNALDNVDANGRAFDDVITPGTKYAYAGGGLEYFPLGRDGIRLHAVYYRDNAKHRNNFDFGVTWKIDIIKH